MIGMVTIGLIIAAVVLYNMAHHGASLGAAMAAILTLPPYPI